MRVARSDDRLDCEAFNERGKWKFTAPGRVTVLPSITALKVTCAFANERRIAAATLKPVGTQVEQIESSRKAGAAVGLGAGTAAGVGVAAMLGAPILVPLTMFAGYVRGEEVGFLTGTIVADRRPGAQPRYPDVLDLAVVKP